MSNPPRLPPMQMNYATPPSLEQIHSGGLHVDGAIIIGPPLMNLPDRCVKCNAVGTKRMKKQYSWHNPLLFLMIIFPGLLIYAIVALIVQKKGTAHFSLCEVHAKRRSRMILFAWLMALLMIAIAVGGCVMVANRQVDEDFVPLFIMVGIFGSLVSAVVGVIGSRVFSPKFIDVSTMRLRGAGSEFLSALRDDPGHAVPVAMPVQMPTA